EGALADLAGAWLSVKEGVPVNLVTNPGFEDSATNTAQPEGDWETEDAPTGWSTWHTASDDTRFYLAGGKGVDDSVAAGIEAADSACYLQSIEVEPGQRYMCSVRARRWHAGMDAVGRLAVRWRTADGSWHSRRDLEPSTTLQGSDSQWQPMALIAEVPEGATTLVLMLSALYLDEESAVLFDNAAVYRLPDGK
ncbi:MAG: hypothetical protein GY851_03170, partial [bacterium]|nr:hypothetical protein [bacterium]